MYIPVGKNTGKPTSTSARVFPNYGCCSKNNLYEYYITCTEHFSESFLKQF